MNLEELSRQYDLAGQTAVVTGGGGVLGGEIARALAGSRASVAVLDLDREAGMRLVRAIDETGGRAMAVTADVLKRETLERAAREVLSRWGRVDILVNAAGGNDPAATTGASKPFFDLPEEALRFVTDLNLLGTILPCQVFGKAMAEAKAGAILNISSMNAFRPLTRIAAYSAAKAAVSNFTQWLAVHMATEHSAAIRVNALAPGFFLTEQNRFLLIDKATGELTDRGRTIVVHTPMGRFGNPEDLVGAALWLLSPLARFVTGIVLPVDGGFSAYAGV
ncbi:MAG TPA: SDR family oxidoreductase [Burkholderiales bacterium]|nr:SDR family oxidoreductase [Burkholderiales bacterium]